jgi:FkbM family methyltransferase
MTAASPTFVSYSANHEDVILNRVFGSCSQGFYIDVGAAHPLFENDTKALYDRGWRGINIEPNAAFYRELAAQRPGDRNVNAVVSDTPGPITYHEVVGTGLSTCDADQAERAATKGFEVVRYPVAAVSLRAVLEESSPATIDLLKVDVEGFELKVLSSNDWSRFRPKVIVAEATYPESPRRRDDGVEAYLIGQGYRRVYFDGLNDFYVERDFRPPAETFDRPPNVFDHYEPYQLQKLRHEAENARIYAASLEQELQKLRHEGENARIYAASLEQELRRTMLANEAASLDVEHAREELQALHQRCHGFATQLEQADERCHGLTTQLEQADERCHGLTTQLEQADERCHGLTTQLEQADSLATQLEQVGNQLSEQLRQLYLSTSWRVTRPLRALKRPRRTLRILLGSNRAELSGSETA